MKYLLTNQNNFGRIRYNWPGGSGKTVKSSGCGACSALMIVENMTEHRYKMQDWINWVLSTGARVNGGTDMTLLSRKLAEKYGFEVTVTSSETALKKHLQSGGMAIANVGGKRSGWAGLFSTAGHFITVLGLTSDGRFVIGDPDMRWGKFNTSFRRNKVVVNGDLVYVDANNLHKDTLARTPNYYLFTKKTKQEETEMRYQTYDALPNWGKEAAKYYMDKGSLKGDEKGNLDLSYDMLRLLCITCPKIYDTVDECPVYAQPTIQKLVDTGVLKGDQNGKLGLTLEMIRMFCIEERSLA